MRDKCYAVCLEIRIEIVENVFTFKRRIFENKIQNPIVFHALNKILSITSIIKCAIWRIINRDTAFVRWKVYSVRSITISKRNWYHFPVNTTLSLSQLFTYPLMIIASISYTRIVTFPFNLFLYILLRINFKSFISFCVIAKQPIVSPRW